MIRDQETIKQLVDMIERWMIRGTDHWFIKPSVWRAIPAARQRALLAEMQKTSHGIGTPLTLSIFDDMRREAAAVAFPPPPTVRSPVVEAYVAEQLNRMR